MSPPRGRQRQAAAAQRRDQTVALGVKESSEPVADIRALVQVAGNGHCSAVAMVKVLN